MDTPCALGHRVRQRGCRSCPSRVLVPGFNDLNTMFPEHAWSWSEHNGNPYDQERSRGEKFWWHCHQSHHYQATIYVRDATTNGGCPNCHGKAVLAVDSIASNSDLMAEWSPMNVRSPETLSPGSTVKVWWRCQRDHEWQATVSSRRTRGCPYCGNKKLLSGYNDLATAHPRLAAQWHHRNQLSPSEIIVGSGNKFWWHCEQGHEWETSPALRIGQGTGCPSCSRVVSAGEAEVALTVESMVREVVENSATSDLIVRNNRSIIAPLELDIMIPDLGLAVEFNGEYWHSSEVLKTRGYSGASEFHEMKRRQCHDVGYRLAFVWEEDWRARRPEVEAALRYSLHGEVPELLRKLEGSLG